MKFWTNPNYPDSAVRTVLHLSGPTEITKYLHDLIMEIQAPFDSYEEMDGCGLVYTSPDIAKRVFKQLHDELYQRQPELIGHPDGVMIENEILCFRGCEVFVWK